MSTANLRKGDVVLTRQGHRRLWDGRHWRVLCRISNCPAQRQGSLDNKFGLCKKHFTQIELKKFQLSSTNHEQYKQIKIVSEEEKMKTSKRQKLNIIIDQLRYSKTISESASIE